MGDRSGGDRSVLDPVDAPDAVRGALARVLASPQFERSPQLASFLAFVVTKAIDGEGEALKAYTIAVGALGREDDFDPQTDPIVRVQAGRVRQALTAYYAAEGMDDPVEISLPVGRYMPVFTVSGDPAAVTPGDPSIAAARTTTAQPRATQPRRAAAASHFLNIAAGGGVIALLALVLVLMTSIDRSTPTSRERAAALETASIGRALFPRIAIETRFDDDLPAWFAEDANAAVVATRVALFDDVTVVTRGPADYRFRMDAQRSDDGARVLARLERVADETLVWSREVATRADEPIDAQSVVHPMRRIVATVFSPYGVLHADVAALDDPPPGFACVAKGYRYFHRESEAAWRAALGCSEELIADGVRHPSLFAINSWLHLDGFRQNRADPEASLVAARRSAEAAIAAQPGSARAQQAMFDYFKVAGDVPNALVHARRARAANALDLDILGDVAAFYISQGGVQDGRVIVRQVDAIAFQKPAWFMSFEVFLAVLRDDEDHLTRAVGALEEERGALAAAAVSAASLLLNDDARRRNAIAALAAHEPAFASDPEAAFLRRGFDAEVAARLGGLVASAIAANG